MVPWRINVKLGLHGPAINSMSTILPVAFFGLIARSPVSDKLVYLKSVTT